MAKLQMLYSWMVTRFFATWVGFASPSTTPAAILGDPGYLTHIGGLEVWVNHHENRLIYLTSLLV